VPLLEVLAIFFPKLHHRAHVHVVKRGKHGGDILRLLEALSDGLAEPRHVHPLLARGIVLGHWRTRGRRRFGLRLPREQRFSRLRHVILEDLAATS
jgi:hypothetical protein